MLAWLSIGLIGGLMAAMITLAANATLAANTQVIAVLRLIGATDMYITGAFVRRFTSRALFGACIGTAVAVLASCVMAHVCVVVVVVVAPVCD